MYFRQPAGITRTEVDACQDCRHFLGGNKVCKPMGKFMGTALLTGMHLDVVFCTERRPELGREGPGT